MIPAFLPSISPTGPAWTVYFWVLDPLSAVLCKRGMLMPLTLLPPSQEQALCELEPKRFPFCPQEVRIGSQKCHVTIQMYTLTWACCSTPKCFLTSWKAVNHNTNIMHDTLAINMMENVMEKEFLSLVGSYTSRHGLFNFNFLGSLKSNLFIPHHSAIFPLAPLELLPLPTDMALLCIVFFVLRHLLCLLSSMDTDVTCGAELSELGGVFFSTLWWAVTLQHPSSTGHFSMLLLMFHCECSKCLRAKCSG